MDKFLFPTDFVILYMEEDDKVPIILSRPFLAIGKTHVEEGELKLRVQGDEVTFHVFQAMKDPDDETNDDINETGYKESMHGYSVNCKGIVIAAKKEKDKYMKTDTKGSKGMGDSVFHPP